MWKDGGLSHEEFNRSLDDFLARSEALGDDWELREASQSPTITKGHKIRYLVKHVVQKVSENYGSASHELDDDDMLVGAPQAEVINDEECSPHEDTSDCFGKFEYHIVFSPSYGVPVLYFTATKLDGKIIGLDEIWSNIPPTYQGRLNEERWTFLTQQEHPILGTPFYQLHPCHTADLMKGASFCTQKGNGSGNSDIPLRNPNYLVTWLSSVGPVVGLVLPLDYS